jgi:hypothetical protein
MTIKTETERQQFRGVVCLHCQSPIPVPAVVGTTGIAFHDGGESSHRNSQVFNLRCPVCHKEKPYWTQEIVNFDGTPEPTHLIARPASMRFFEQVGLAKAAKV